MFFALAPVSRTSQIPSSLQGGFRKCEERALHVEHKAFRLLEFQPSCLPRSEVKLDSKAESCFRNQAHGASGWLSQYNMRLLILELSFQAPHWV